MEITKEVVKGVSDLAQLEINDNDVRSLIDGMQTILDLADQMQTIDTANIEPVANPLDAKQVLRPDVVTEKNQRELFQSVAPAVEDGLYLVPRVVE